MLRTSDNYDIHFFEPHLEGIITQKQLVGLRKRQKLFLASEYTAFHVREGCVHAQNFYKLGFFFYKSNVILTSK